MVWHPFLAFFVTALLLGAIIGAERQWHQRIAGLRTNALVSAGAAMFVSITHLVPLNPTSLQVAAQVVSGIGLPNRFSKSEMQEGEYFAQFEFKGVKYITNFAVIDSYQRCDGTLVEIDFSDAKKAKIQSFVDFNDSGEACRESEPQCYRK